MVVFLVVQTTFTAQTLNGKSSLFLSGGLRANSRTFISTNTNYLDTKSDFNEAINYEHWFSEEWALTISAGVIGLQTNTTPKYSGTTITINSYIDVGAMVGKMAGSSISAKYSSTLSVIPVLIGGSYYPQFLSINSIGRPYIAVAVGGYKGNSYGMKIPNQFLEEFVFGGLASVGVDFLVGSGIIIGPKVSYDILSDFTQILNSNKNLSGASIALDFGLIF